MKLQLEHLIYGAYWCSCLMLRLVSLPLSLSGNMQSLSASWLSCQGSWQEIEESGRRIVRLQARVSEVTAVSANCPWHAPDASFIRKSLKGASTLFAPVRDRSSACTGLWFVLLGGFQARHNDSRLESSSSHLLSSFMGSFATISINISRPSASRRPCCLDASWMLPENNNSL